MERLLSMDAFHISNYSEMLASRRWSLITRKGLSWFFGSTLPLMQIETGERGETQRETSG